MPIRWVIGRDPKHIFKTQALLCRDLTIAAEQIVQGFPRHWQVEVTFHKTRTHLGVDTQSQCTDLAIFRITPTRLSLFPLVTLPSNVHAQKHNLPIRQTARYVKKLPAFSDALSIVQQTSVSEIYFRTSPVHREVQELPPRHLKYRSATTSWAFL